MASQVVRINGADNWTMAIFLPVKMIGKVEDVLAPIFQGGFEVFVWTKTNHHTQDAGNHLGSCVEHILLCYYAKGGTRLREHYNYAPDESRQDFLGCRVPRSFYYNGSPVNRTQKPMMLISHLILHFSVEGSWVLDLCAGSGTTSHCAMLNLRHFVAVEMDPLQFQACVHRVEACPDFDDRTFPQDNEDDEDEEEGEGEGEGDEEGESDK